MIGWRHNHQSMESHARNSLQTNKLDPFSIWRPSFPGMGIPMLKIRWSHDHLVFNMGIPMLVRQHLYIENTPWMFTNPGQWSIISVCCEPCHTHVVISGSSLWTLMGFSCSWHCYAVINFYTVDCHYNTVNILHNTCNMVSFVSLSSTLCSTSITTPLYSITYDIGPH